MARLLGSHMLLEGVGVYGVEWCGVVFEHWVQVAFRDVAMGLDTWSGLYISSQSMSNKTYQDKYESVCMVIRVFHFKRRTELQIIIHENMTLNCLKVVVTHNIRTQSQ